MIFLVNPSSYNILYRLALFSALMVMAFFEAKLYMDSHNLKNKKDYYKVTFLANAIVGLFLFIPVYWFDILTFILYWIRSIPVGIMFIKLNKKKTKQQARNNYLITLLKNILVFIGYNFVFFLLSLLLGFLYSIIQGYIF